MDGTLHNNWIEKLQIFCDFFGLLAKSHFFENRVVPMQRVTHFVQTIFLFVLEFARCIKGVSFEKISNLISRFQKIGVISLYGLLNSLEYRIRQEEIKKKFLPVIFRTLEQSLWKGKLGRQGAICWLKSYPWYMVYTSDESEPSWLEP